MRHGPISRPNLHAWCSAIDEEARDALLGSPGRFLFTSGDEHDHEIGDVGVADEVLGAVDHPIVAVATSGAGHAADVRSEEHTSELQSHLNLVCRLLLEKKKKVQ